MLAASHAGAFAGIDLGLAPPPTQRLLRDTEFAGHGLDGLELGNIRGLHRGLQQPQRTLPKLRRILTGHSFQSSYEDRNKTWGSSDGREGTASVSGVLVEFGEWLDRQRGLAPITIDNYCCNVAQFLEALPQPTQVSVSLVDAGTVTAFMVEYCRDRNTNSVKSMARSVRSFLRFAHATGRTSVGLWGAVPVSAGWQLASLPKSVPAADLERLLAVAGRWRFTATDRRDYEILLLLARLGLRRGEVAGLRLDDID